MTSLLSSGHLQAPGKQQAINPCSRMESWQALISFSSTEGRRAGNSHCLKTPPRLRPCSPLSAGFSGGACPLFGKSGERRMEGTQAPALRRGGDRRACQPGVPLPAVTHPHPVPWAPGSRPTRMLLSRDRICPRQEAREWGPRAGPPPRLPPVGAAPGWASLRLETPPLFKLIRPRRGVPRSGHVHGWPCFLCRTILLAPGRSALLSRFSPRADSSLSERLLFLAQIGGGGAGTL